MLSDEQLVDLEANAMAALEPDPLGICLKKFHSAVNPTVALEMIAEIRRLRAEANKIRLERIGIEIYKNLPGPSDYD